MQKKIAIQGYRGCFHEAAASEYFGNDIDFICCPNFREVVQNAQDPTRCDGAIMAIENSIAGSILPNYHLLQFSELKITGEVYLPIGQNLLVNPGVQLSDITEVQSHPMALLQCAEYLEQFPWKLVATEDTALSAKWVADTRSKNVAGIAGVLAARLFGLDVLAPNIETMKNNYTRFWILEREESKEGLQVADKASLIFETDHSKGSLAKVLTKIAERDINLSKLQSMPIPGSDWKYTFYADCEFNHLSQIENMMEDIKNCTASASIYGMYKNGKNIPLKNSLF